jgi:hypothetical protein
LLGEKMTRQQGNKIPEGENVGSMTKMLFLPLVYSGSQALLGNQEESASVVPFTLPLVVVSLFPRAGIRDIVNKVSEADILIGVSPLS